MTASKQIPIPIDKRQAELLGSTIRLSTQQSHLRLAQILDTAVTNLTHVGAPAIESLTAELQDLFSSVTNEDEIAKLVRQCRAHDIFSIVQSDPYTRRAWEKPRGYAGDAVMLDYIYRPTPPKDFIAREVYEATTSSNTGKSVLWRSQLIGAKLGALGASAAGQKKVLAIACGHMRELDYLARDRAERLEVLAIDQDAIALEECTKYSLPRVRTLHAAFAEVFTQRFAKYGKFDFIYAAGLTDYLSDNLLKRLITRMFELTAEGGTSLICNFTPKTPGRMFMEIFMDWQLHYRTEDELGLISTHNSPQASIHTFSDPYGNVAYVELRRNKADRALS